MRVGQTSRTRHVGLALPVTGMGLSRKVGSPNDSVKLSLTPPPAGLFALLPGKGGRSVPK